MHSNASKPRTKKPTNVGGRPARAGKAATGRIAMRLTKQEHDALVKAAHHECTAPGVLARSWILKELRTLGLLALALGVFSACASDVPGDQLADADPDAGMGFAGSAAPIGGGMAPVVEHDAGEPVVDPIDPVAAGSGGAGGTVATAGHGGAGATAGKGGAGSAAGMGGTSSTAGHAAGAGGSIAAGSGGTGGAGGSPATGPTMCKIKAGQPSAGQTIFCGGFWQQYFSDHMLTWAVTAGSGGATYNCNQPVQCVKGAACEWTKIDGSAPAEVGVCQ